jgi:hypothetical protein
VIRRLLLLARTNRSLRQEVNHLRERFGREVTAVTAENRSLTDTNRIIREDRAYAQGFIERHGLADLYWRERLIAAQKRPTP